MEENNKKASLSKKLAEKKAEIEQKKIKLQFILTLISVFIFIVITAFSMATKKYVEYSFHIVAIIFLVIYCIVFIALLAYLIVNKNYDKQKLKNVKMAGGTFKSILAISNKLALLINLIGSFSLSITQYQAITQSGGKVGIAFIFTLIATLLSIIAAILFIIRKIVKLYIKNKKIKAKQLKQAQKENKKQK